MATTARAARSGQSSTSDHALLRLKRLPDLFLSIALGAIIVNDLSKKFFGYQFFDSPTAIVTLAAPIILAFGAVLVRLLLEIKAQLDLLERPHPDVVAVLPGEGAFACADLLTTRSKVDILTLAGGVIIPLDQEDVRNAIRDSTRPSRIRCLIANPYSDAIVGRYAHDEPAWKERGTEAIETRLTWLFNLVESMGAPPARLNVKVYDSYPMLSVFRADEDVYASYYAFRLRGNDTPTLLSSTGAPLGKAVMKHFEKLYDESPSLAEWIVRHYSRLRRPEDCRFSLRYSGVFLETPDGSLVLQRRDRSGNIVNPGQLSVFGGQASDNESAIETVQRELREETGLRPNTQDFKFVVAIPSVEDRDSQRCMLCTYYLLRNVDPSTVKAVEGSSEQMTAEQALAVDDLSDMPRRILSWRSMRNTWPSGSLDV